MLNETLEENIRLTKKEIEKADIMIGFFRWMAEREEKDKEKSATYKVKADQLEASKKVNELFLEYAKEHAEE